MRHAAQGNFQSFVRSHAGHGLGDIGLHGQKAPTILGFTRYTRLSTSRRYRNSNRIPVCCLLDPVTPRHKCTVYGGVRRDEMMRALVCV
jgi:hypothetical protein